MSDDVIALARVMRIRGSCKRECVTKWLRVVNLIVNVWGVGMIIYSLCLRELWISVVSQLPPSQHALPCPWFIFTCLIVGIVVCLSTLWGHMVANCITHPTLFTYVSSLSTLLLLQGVVIVVVFFKMDLGSQINNLIDKHESFKKFVIFHFRMCCLVSILVFVAQVTVAYNKDPSPVKLNLGVGAYRTEEGKPLVLNVVRKAEQLLVNDRSRVKEYLPIVGLAEFNKLSAKLMFGEDSPAIRENRVTTVQCLSGTGSLRVGGEFLARHYHQRTIYIPQPTWGNHPKVFSLSGLSVKTYRYYDPATRGLDFKGLLEDLGSAPSGAIVLLHACAHNPTGVDPTPEQWEKIRQLVRSKGFMPFFDSAYQGFASGSLDKDAQAVRMFVADGGECLVAQSYAKNMGLYGERVGALSIVCKSADVASRVESQLKLVIRPMFSNPPIHGASIVATVLRDKSLFNEWTIELKGMADRIISMRQKLFDALRARGTPGDWSHIIKQIGMFTFTGLNKEQVAFMTKEYHIYMTSDGRISMAGLSSKTVPHLADAIHAAVTRMS